MIAITGATGQLGQLVIKHLQTRKPGLPIAAIVRNVEKAKGLGITGVEWRQADYGNAAALEGALKGVTSLLLISSNEFGQRTTQHANVVAAAAKARVGRIVYTSLLHADTSILNLASDHAHTEALIRKSGLPHVILRNGWYTENYAASVGAALHLGAFYGSAGNGRISSAARTDYAEAAAAVLLSPPASGTVYELAGDTSYTLSEFAAELSRLARCEIPYRDIPEAAYREALLKAGLPEPLASGLANWDTGASKGALFDEGRQLSTLIGRPTTPLAATLKAALSA